MGTENKDIMKKQKLEIFGILKEALTIPYKSINFIIFTIVTLLPLFCFLIYFENLLLKTIVETSDILVSLPYFDHDWPLPEYFTNLNNDFPYKLIQLSLLYLVPLRLLELFNMLQTIDFASKIYKKEQPMSLKEMVDEHIYMRKLRGVFITSIYVLFWSSCMLLGLIWLVISYFTLSINLIYNVLFAILYGGGLVALLTKYLEWSAQWNMSIVISILEEISGIDALVLSGNFNKGNEKRGRALMLVFFVWGLCLRLPCLFLGCQESGIGMILRIVLLIMGTVIKWVASMVYFYDCKRKILEQRVDEEVGIVVTAADE